ncbi:MAG TPA: glycosyltransferase [Pyrinomonadaceae bacterium]|nr:glycosyltransferase [Pyrinomonadaceae bacterium]
MKKKILIICFTHLHRDPRILRQISWLRENYEITTLGFSPSNVEGVRHIPFEPERNSRLAVKLKRAAQYFTKDYESFYWNAAMKELLKKAANFSFDAIIANDIDTLPLAVKLAENKAKVIFDAHEYAPLEHEESRRFRLLRQPFVEYLCREYLPKVTAATTVCQGIADLFERNYGRKFSIITNASEYREISPSAVNPEKIRLIYHGGAFPGRGLENQIEMMNFLDEKYELNLMLLGDEKYIERLKKIAGSNVNIKFLPPVSFAEIIDFTNQFDIGVYSLAPTNTNNRLALPNKLFEYIQARLAIVVSPSPEMKRLVEEFDLGIVAKDFEPQSLAQVIEQLSAEKISYYKNQADKHAFELSAQKNKEIFLRLLKE